MKITSGILLLALILMPFMHLSAQTDCPDAIIVCGPNSYTGLNATGIGTQEISTANACSSQEHNSLWLKILIKDGGTLGFILTPESEDLVVDFDFWIYGPNVTCGSLGTAIRCSTTNPGAAGLDYNITGMNETETDVSEGPNGDGNAWINWMNVADNDIYYLVIDRPHGVANFSLQWTGTATFHEIPVFLNPDNIPLEIVKCDDDGVTDESVAFDLTVFADMFIGPQTDVALTYHLDTNGMLTGDDPLENPESFANTSNPQTIYMRMTNTVTGCFDTETLTISVDTDIPVGEPAPLVLCDTNSDGFREFDLTQNDAAISNGNPGTAVTYYASEDNARHEENPLPGMYQNQAAYATQTIWARLETTGGCYRYGITSFTITVLPLPEMMRNDDFPPTVPLEIVQCDDDGTDDDTTIFDLTEFEAMLKGTQTDVTLTYHTNTTDVQTGENPVTGPEAFANTSSPQVIYMRMTNTVTGCFTNEALTIRIDHTLPLGNPEELLLCDIDGDGLGEFDLSLNDEAISNNNPNVAVTYYASQEDAEGEISPLPPAYHNQSPYTVETIWARAETTSGCFRHGITSFDINVYPVPEMMRNESFPPEIPLRIVKCDDDGVNDNSVAFDLTSFEDMLIGTQTGVALTYYEEYNDALNGTDPLDSPEAYANTSTPQTVFMRMTYTATGCFVTEILTISIDSGLPTGTPAPLALCDAGNGLMAFNLTQNDEAIINGTPNTAVTYYASQADAQNKVNPLPATYQNQQPYISETIWARLETTQGCFRYGITSFTITVHHLPEMMRNNDFPAGIPLEISQCDDDGVHDGSVAFDLTQFEAMLTGTQTGTALAYYTDADSMLAGENPIASPEAYANTANPQTIYLRMTNGATGCFTTETLTLRIDYTLPTGEPATLSLCDTDGNGFRNFDLTENDAAIKDGNSNSIITYYASEEDAENGINAISGIYRNQLPYVPEMIWARLENITGCYGLGITAFTIAVLPAPEITYTVDVVDFTQNANRITIGMPGGETDNYEFSLDGVTFGDATVFDGLAPGLYMLHIRSKDQCSTTSTQIPILNYPKFFTPNGDGVNELWNVFFIYFFPDATVNIFDRYGKLVKSYLGKELGWDGTYNGERLPSTDYWFEVVFTSGRKIKGHFSMIR